MDPQKNYVTIVRTVLARNTSIGEIIMSLRQTFIGELDGETKKYLECFLQFLTRVQLAIGKMKGENDLSIGFMPELKGFYRIEFFGIAKLLIQEHGFTPAYAPANSAEETALIIHRLNLDFILCDGCKNVREPHPHSCHKGNMRLDGSSVDMHCECQDCLEVETFRLLGVFGHDDWSGMQDYLKKIAAHYAANASN